MFPLARALTVGMWEGRGGVGEVPRGPGIGDLKTLHSSQDDPPPGMLLLARAIAVGVAVFGGGAEGAADACAGSHMGRGRAETPRPGPFFGGLNLKAFQKKQDEMRR